MLPAYCPPPNNKGVRWGKQIKVPSQNASNCQHCCSPPLKLQVFHPSEHPIERMHLKSPGVSSQEQPHPPLHKSSIQVHHHAPLPSSRPSLFRGYHGLLEPPRDQKFRGHRERLALCHPPCLWGLLGAGHPPQPPLQALCEGHPVGGIQAQGVELLRQGGQLGVRDQ